MINIKDLVKNKPLLFDGAMGTSIQNLGLEDIEPLELLTLKYPEKLAKIHQDYINAGCKVIETNTFGGSRPRLELNNLGSKVEEINKAAVKTAIKFKNDKVFVAGSVGPTGLMIEPYGDIKKDKVRDYYKEQIGILLNEGVDLILIETMISLDEALIALEASMNMGSSLTGVTMTFDIGNSGIRTPFGDSPFDICVQLKEGGANFIGANCGLGFKNMLSVAQELRQNSDLPILIQPNAGFPEVREGKIFYNESAEMYSDFVKQILEIGIDFVGGCCGTTVQHIQKAAEVIASKKNK